MPTSVLTTARDREIVRVTAAHRTLEGDRVPTVTAFGLATPSFRNVLVRRRFRSLG